MTKAPLAGKKLVDWSITVKRKGRVFVSLVKLRRKLQREEAIMRRRGIWLLLVLLLPVNVCAQQPADAVVKISVLMPVEGRQGMSCGSGTVIETSAGRSVILTCAHLWTGSNEQPDPQARTRRIVLDAPAPLRRGEAHVGVQLARIDYAADLALIEVGAELPYRCHVAPAGTHARNLVSAGYDEARLPGVRVLATPLGTSQGWTWTREIPVNGRSGGALIDQETGCLVGVCHGYESWPGGQRGQYVPLATILAFLGRGAGPALSPPDTSPPQAYDPFAPQYAARPAPPVYAAPQPYAPACTPGGS